ncbi:MAG: hypothetical protein JF888_15015 [Candidatus Dormibacteraeota bacterium]|uniref:Uncharacterized protein n=1 Tax=Candidatus Dormiibacter inghamiae TaxID=3127013 RepID=A0A934KLY4_9BACT|nr:hypothetical protein [Candidatus Dormibacteraeota bacterium]MBJ7606906.1 hypothetical protein [Candidatus Dormibacteraeota bacterium]
MGTILRVSMLEGEAALGRIRASDVGHMLVDVERVFARAAAHFVAGRPGRGQGRRGRLIEEATHLRLVGLEEGSVVCVLQFPDAPPNGVSFDLGDVISLGETALTYAVSTATEGRRAYSDVAAALVQLANDIGVGSRCKAVALSIGDDRQPEVVIDAERRERLRLVAAPAPNPRADAITGTLVEADFERRTARLRTPLGQAIAVQFDPDIDDAIYELMRRTSKLRGEITYDPSTLQARAIRVRGLGKAEQMELATSEEDFWQAPRPFAELLHERGAAATVDLDALYIPTLTDEQRDELVKAADSGAI